LCAGRKAFFSFLRRRISSHSQAVRSAASGAISLPLTRRSTETSDITKVYRVFAHIVTPGT
jgi:hypothetical protein